MESENGVRGQILGYDIKKQVDDARVKLKEAQHNLAQDKMNIEKIMTAKVCTGKVICLSNIEE